MRFPRRAVAPAVFLLAMAIVLGVFAFRDARAGDSFDLVRWERATLANKWLQLLGAPFRDDLDDDEAIRRYFALDDRTTEEARALENMVEAAIESRIDKVLDDLGIDGRLPLPGSVFPPVDIELASSPSVLVISPRDYIERTSDDLLRPDLAIAEIERLEQAAEANGQSSALVVSTGGVATYPAVINEGRSYAGTVTTAAHEWMHHYLAFYTLGRSYYASPDARTINETVADVVGDEVAAIVIERWGDPTQPAATPTATPSATLTVAPAEEPSTSQLDRNAVLRDLRLEVDELLADGQIEEAEARMEAVRLELCDAGFCLRRLNQAHFAWYGTYAARPDATDPLGPQIFELRERSGSLAEFVRVVRGLKTRAEIELLVEAG